MTTQAIEEFEYEALPDNASLSASLLAGAFAGIAEHAVMYPVDSIKVYIYFNEERTNNDVKDLGVLPQPPPPSLIFHIIGERGIGFKNWIDFFAHRAHHSAAGLQGYDDPTYGSVRGDQLLTGSVPRLATTDDNGTTTSALLRTKSKKRTEINSQDAQE